MIASELGNQPSMSNPSSSTESELTLHRLSGYVNQLSVEVEALGQLVKLVKAGRHTGTVGVPKSVVVIGFSFGSFVTNTLVANEPGLMDGAIFTGLGFAPTAFAPFFEAYSPRIASHADPRFAGYDTGVLTWVDLYANINT
jgi:dienelactone hydrolase